MLILGGGDNLDNPDYLKPDGIHLTTEGRERYFKKIELLMGKIINDITIVEDVNNNIKQKEMEHHHKLRKTTAQRETRQQKRALKRRVREAEEDSEQGTSKRSNLQVTIPSNRKESGREVKAVGTPDRSCKEVAGRIIVTVSKE